MNRVIENVLQLSRRQQTVQRLDLETVAGTLRCRKPRTGERAAAIHLRITGGDFITLMDPDQLTQILDNLLRNGWRHSALLHEQAEVWLALFIDPDSQLAILEIQDDGPGVPRIIKRNCSNPSSPPAARAPAWALSVP
jgi:two-component system sensor histidine kinase PilS (NtrC family)